MEKNLKKYNQKRDFKKTDEPVGKKKVSSKKKHFVVQHHLARKEHYDLRLEYRGSMLSWAVPKGPSYNTRDKRLAIHVEDHPIDYRNFEGTIPKGQYGGGTVMIWDEGFYEILFFDKKMIKFQLFGKRLKGKWTLVQFKDKHWLLLKEKDTFHGFKNINKFTTSIRTGRTMKEIEEKKLPKNKEKFQEMDKVLITNPDKIIYSKPKILKKDLVAYYKKVAERMMPYLENRLFSSIRCPDGMKGTTFYKKHFENKNKNLGRKNISCESHHKEDYYYIKNAVGLIEEVQMNGYEFHIWGSKYNQVAKPDIIIFDLDPDKNLSLEKVRCGVKDLKSILDELSLVSFLKTSGGKGYHVVVPISSFKNWNEAKEFSKNIAILMEQKWPEKYTSNIRIQNRKGKIFIDWLRNTKGATSVCPYSIRLKKKLSISMPIRFSELDKIKPDEITIESALKRLNRKDPWENFWNLDQ